MNSARRVSQVIALVCGAILLGAVSASAQISDAKCADRANNFGRKVSSKQNKANRKCIKDEGKGKLATTVETCLTADDKGKLQKKKDKVDALFASGGACEGLEGTDLVTGANTINVAHQGESIGLIHDIFGPDLDAGQILQTKPERKCQDKMVKRAGQLFDKWVLEFRKCKKTAIKKQGATTTAEVVAACLGETGVDGTGSALPDPKSKVDKKGQKLADDIQKRCVDEGLDTDLMAPGACAGGGVQGDFTKCMQDLAECRACKAVKTADNLGAVNCDLVDNGKIDQSCPQGCEVLNDVECFLPYPSSHFLVPDATKQTGLRLSLPAEGMPPVNGPEWLPDAFNELDGFSPMVHILMHFPQGLDLTLSDTARLLEPQCCGQPAGPPWIDTRTYTERSLDADSPSVLMKADTGERILHFLELDARATGPQIPGQQVVFLRPGVSLEPGERYIVAMRNLKTAANTDVVAEPAFAALRDDTPTNDLAIEERRAQMESDVFAPLVANGIDRSELVLAFDFTVQSDDQLTRQMLSMRDQAFTWLSTVESTPGLVTFTVQATTPVSNCTDPDDVEWKKVSGTYASPLFLTGLPVQNSLQILNVDTNDLPVQNGFMDAPFDISIPCSVFDGGVTSRPLYLGHGIFGTGQGMVDSIPNQKARFADWTYIAGGTDWIGLSSRRDDTDDQLWILNQIIGNGTSQLNNFEAFPDRLRQGMLNALVLAKMMKLGLFNRDSNFEKSPGVGVFPGPSEDMFYYGISLGGIHGTWMSALSPDMERFGLDVPAINFSCLLQRSTQFGLFELVIQAIGISDPIHFATFLGLANELWVSAEPAGYATHITTNPLSGSGTAKKLYYTPSWLDKQVSNQCTEAAVRTLGLTNLTGSIQQQLVDIPDATGPVDSGVILYDPGAFDILNPLHVPEFPALANVIPTNTCDPHNGPRNIPAAIRSLINFLQPDGEIENFCDGLCDAAEPLEIPNGGNCDGTSPPADQGKICADDDECNGGTCVAVAFCGECDAGSPLADQGKPCDANSDCNGGTCVFATIP